MWKVHLAHLLHRAWQESLKSGSSSNISVFYLTFGAIILSLVITVLYEWRKGGWTKTALKAVWREWPTYVIPLAALTILWVGLFTWSVAAIIYGDHIELAAAAKCRETPTAPTKSDQPSQTVAQKRPSRNGDVTIHQKGNGNTANPGSITGSIVQGNCGVVENGGTGNVASPNCVPPERHLSPEQMSTLRGELRSMQGVRLSIWSENPTPEMRAYEQDWFDMCMQIGQEWTCQQPSTGLGAPTPKGVVIQVPNEGDPLGEKLKSILKDAGVESRVEPSAYLDEYNARIIIGSQ